ncbi:MAG: MBL fold metallo-hydrolase [Proteobacteria bacterium]|nr:MBL fold metallo-hydrolase [Pseudomonadota bacterium]
MTVADFKKKIVWLGHDAFRINASKTIYIDPYEITGGPPADLILISHDHYDHCSPEDVKKILSPKTVIVTEKKSAKKLTGHVKVVKPGDTLTVEDVIISIVPAYNLNKKFHPRKNEGLGFMIEIDGINLYHAGDTDFIPEMKGISPDIALLPVSGTFVMTAAEAVDAALALSPQLAIPMHYGSLVGNMNDAEVFKNNLKGKIEVLILPKAN